ncbi:MAG: cytochrome c oxidase subunit I [Enhydrobacter sp.]|nr:MAG: cytochrome c oxidase subunit I [Enhydrobacter sp.]
MTPSTPRSPIRLHKELDALWGTRGRLGWLSAVNHNVVGKRFIVTSIAFFAIGGLLAMLIRAQLASPRSAFVGPEIYNQIFTMHGTIMMFLFAIPLFEGLAMYLLPKMLGARDLAFPRLSAYGYWCYLFGGSILIFGMLAGVAPDSGWFMYTPLSSQPFTPGINADIWLIGITFVEISALCGAIEIIVSVLKVRAPGMSVDRLPLLAWFLLITAFMMLAGFPPLILGSILLELERALGLPFFDPERGGDALLWQHLFWLFGHPEVYIIFLPAAGVVSMIVPAMAGRRILGYAWIVVAAIALAFLSFGLWVHHMFTVGIPHLALGFFSAASMLVAVPTAVQIFAWLGTLMAGRPQLRLPMLYVVGFFLVFVPGGLTGVMVAAVPFDQQAHDTHFVVAHLHYVLVGGFVFPMLAAAYYWLPLFTGRSVESGIGITGFWLILVGFNLAFLVMHLTGLLGMPRRVFTYEAHLGWDWPNLVSSIGAFILTMGFAAVLLDIVLQFRTARRSGKNPWGGTTLEWATPKPAPNYNFASLPSVGDRDPLLGNERLGPQLAAGCGYLAFTRNRWLETLGVETATGKPEQIIVLPAPTLLPLYSACFTAVFFVAALFKMYEVALAGAAFLGVTFLFWAREVEAPREYGLLPAGHDMHLRTHREVANPPARMAMLLTLVADGTLYACLIFGVLFLWLVAPNWPPDALLQDGWIEAGMAGTAWALAAWGARLASRPAAIGSDRCRKLLLAVVAANAVALVGGIALIGQLPDAAAHAYAAGSLVVVVYTAFHAGVAIVLGLQAWSVCRRKDAPTLRRAPVDLAWIWQIFSTVGGILGLVFVCVLPHLIAG